MSYIYFDINGRLREYVTTPKRKGSENVDTLFVYWEGNDGTVVLPSQCFIEYGHENIHAGPLTANKTSRTIIPFDRERDLKFFQYGKTYQFMCFDLPTAVSSTSGFWHSSVSIHDRLTDNVVQVLGDITFEIEESSIVPSGNLNLSQYNYILDKVDQTLAKYDSKLDRKAPTSIVDSNENSIVDFHDNDVTFYKPVHVNNEFRVKNDMGIIIEGNDGLGKFSSIFDDYDLNEFSFITDRKAFYLTFREDVTKGLVFDSSQTLSLRNGTEFLNDANTKTVLGQNLKGSRDIHTWNGTPTDPKDITTKEYVDTKVSAETDGVVKRGDLKTLNGESLLGSGDITYDTFLSPTSTNAVQNKVVNSTISELSYQLAMVRENLFETVLSEIDYTEDFATLYPIPDTLSDTDGTHRVLFSETQLREVAGNSVAYNQLASNDALSNTVEGITMTNNGDGSFTLNGTATENSYIRLTSTNIFFIKGRKYLFTGMDKIATSYTRDQMLVYVDAPYTDFLASKLVTIGEQPTRETAFFLLTMKGVTFNNLVIRPQLFDLTLMGLDSVSTVEEAKSELLKRGIDIDQYNPFSKGEIRNTTASGVKVNGYNLLNLNRTEGTLIGFSNTNKRNFDLNKYYIGLSRDGYYDKTAVTSFGISGNQVKLKSNQNGYGIAFPMKVEPGKSYTLSATVTSDTAGYNTGLGIGYYNSEGLNIGFTEIENKSAEKSKAFTTPSGCSLIVVVLYASTHINLTTFSNICFHLSTLRTGYAPYKEPKAISFASTELLGAGEAHDTIEVVEGDKVAGIQRYNLVHVKRVGTVDLGTLGWNYNSKYKRFGASFTNGGAAGGGANTKANIICPIYSNETGNHAYSGPDGGYDKCISLYIATFYICDSSYTDATAFKTAMSGVIVNYELATPTRTTIAENLTFEEVSAAIEQGGSIETIYETLAPNCTTGFVVKKATEVSK